MTRPHPRLATAAAAAVCAVTLAGCGTPAGLTATGRVDDPADTVSAPAFAGAEVVTVADALPLGTRVVAGDPVAHLNPSLPDAALASARAEADLAASRVALIESQGADVKDKASDLREKRDEVSEAIDTMVSKRPELVDTRADLLAKRTELKATLATLTSQRAEVAATVATLTKQRDTLTAAIAELEEQRALLEAAPVSPEQIAGLAQIDAALAEARAGLTQVTAGLAQATAGLAKLDEGLTTAREGATQLDAALTKVTQGIATLDANLAEARKGLVTIDDALDELATALKQLESAAEAARAGVRAAAASVSWAEHQRSLATLTAPSDGVVVATSLRGDVLAPSAPVVVVRPDAAASVTTWVTPGAASGLCDGDRAIVRTDWGTTHEARVTRVGVRSEYPPSSLATDEVHLTRAVEVTATLAAGDHLPAGAPVDLTLTACREETS